MSFIYSFIARSKNVILTEFTDYTGNFQQYSIEYLKKVKSNTQCSISTKE